MLRIAEPVPALNAAERFALHTLLDLARVLIAEADATVTVRIADTADCATLPACRGRNWGVAAGAAEVTVQRSMLRLVADIAGVVAEQRTDAEDRYGRVPPAMNAVVSAGSERDPVVNRVAQALRVAAVGAAGRAPFGLVAPWPEGKRWAVAMSHDLDVVSAWPAFTALRVAELLRKGDPARALDVLVGAAGAVLSDPVTAAARHVMEVERTRGVRSTWFVITGSPTFATVRAGDVTYTPETPRARRIIREVGDAGFEVGLHGSFETFVTASRFARQRDRLRAIVGADVRGVRQHFLRMRPGVSHRAMQDAGFQYDSTYGFPDRNGFRLGTADVTRAWDDAAAQVLALDALPFVWMDRALSKYRGIEAPSAWIEDGLQLADTCREVDGVWTGIWHPNLATPLGFPGAAIAFEALVEGLMRHDPWPATMSEIVAWRAARRDARAAGLDAAGRIRLRAADPRVCLEDASGLTVPAVVG